VPVSRADVIIDSVTAGTLRIALQDALRSLGPLSGDILADPMDGKTVLLTRAGAVLTGVRLANGAPSLARLAAIREKLPHVGLYVVARSARELEPWLRELAAQGVDDAFCLEHDTDWRLMAVELERRVHAPPPEEPLRRLSREWQAMPECAMALHMVRNAFRPRSIDSVVRWFGLSEKTMRARLVDAGLPSPGFLHRFGHALHALALWRRGSMEQVARRLGLANAKDLQARRRRVERRVAHWPVLQATLRAAAKQC
jgi:hypothetical protein